jgi:hypothetical protein
LQYIKGILTEIGKQFLFSDGKAGFKPFENPTGNFKLRKQFITRNCDNQFKLPMRYFPVLPPR